jgi:hypothetical protein
MRASSFAAGTGRYRPAPAVTGSTPLVFAGTGRYRLSTTNGTVPSSSHRNSLLACRTRCSLAAPAARLPHPLLTCRTRCSLAAPAAPLPHPLLPYRIRCPLGACRTRRWFSSCFCSVCCLYLNVYQMVFLRVFIVRAVNECDRCSICFA